MSRRVRDRRGVALLVVLTALAVALWLGLSLHLVSLGGQRRQGETRAIVAAAAAVDASVWEVIAQAAALRLDTLPLGGRVGPFPGTIGPATVETQVVRTGPWRWLVASTAWSPGRHAARRAVRHASLVLRPDLPVFPLDAAVTARGAVTVTGSGMVIGADTSHAALAPGCFPTALGAGVAVPDTSQVTGGGTVTGAPALLADPRAALPATYLAWGHGTWSAMVARARIRWPDGAVLTPSPVVVGGLCDTTSGTNWGEPQGAGPCRHHAPIVVGTGSLELRGGQGQGVLLVDGDLTLSGGVRFEGVIIVRDDVRSGPGGGWVRGLVLAADSLAVPGDQTLVSDGVRLERAACIAAAAFLPHVPFQPVRHRAWLPM